MLEQLYEWIGNLHTYKHTDSQLQKVELFATNWHNFVQNLSTIYQQFANNWPTFKKKNQHFAYKICQPLELCEHIAFNLLTICPLFAENLPTKCKKNCKTVCQSCNYFPTICQKFVNNLPIIHKNCANNLVTIWQKWLISTKKNMCVRQSYSTFF